MTSREANFVMRKADDRSVGSEKTGDHLSPHVEKGLE
jgi:hypothetical protein